MKRKIVLTRNHQQFLEYCHKENINPRDTQRVLYASSKERIRGLRNCEIVTTGEYWLSPVFGDPYLELITRDS